jgi:hypothetical protein
LLTSTLTIGDNILITTATKSYTGYIESFTNTSITFLFKLGEDIGTMTITKLEKTRKADVTTIQGFFSTNYQYFGFVTAPNGKLYGMPWDVSNVLIIDPDSPIVNITISYGITVSNVTYTSSLNKLTCSGASLLTGLTIGDNIIITTASKTYTGYIQSLTNTVITFLNQVAPADISAGSISKLEKTRKADLTTLSGLSGGAGSTKFAGGVLAPNGIVYGIPNSAENVLQVRTGLPTLPPWMLEAYFNKY